MHALDPLQHVPGVLRTGDGSSVTQHHHVWVDPHGFVTELLDELDAVIKALAAGRPDGPAGLRALCVNVLLPYVCVCEGMGLLTVKPIWQTRTSAPASAIFLLSSTVKTYGVVSMSIWWASRTISTSLSKDMPVSSRLARNCPSINPTVGKFCTPANPSSFSCLRNAGMLRNGSVAHTPAITGVFLTTGSTSLA